MPSGSHGGSPGSHSSGGSSFGGSGSSGGNGGNRSSGGSRRSRTRIYFFGRTYYIPNKISGYVSLLFAFLFFSVTAIFMTSNNISASNQVLTRIKNDYEYYQGIIDIAKDKNYILEAKVTDTFLNEKGNKYFITYTIYSNGIALDGYSYSVYTNAEALALLRQETIQVAVTSLPITEKTDSVPLDYEDMPLSRDGEYIMTINNLKRQKIYTTIAGVIASNCLIGIIVLCIKYKQKEETPIGDIEDIAYATNTTTSKKRQCKYCGNKNSFNDNSCNSCGARLDDE